MAGMIGLGSALNRQATGVLGNASGLESVRKQEGDMAKSAEKSQAVGLASSGAGIGALIGSGAGAAAGTEAGAALGSVVPGAGTLIGAGIGALGGWLGSRLF